MSEVLSGRVSKHRRDRRVKNSTVLRMMAIMQEGNSEVPKEFLETGRTGRRNAMPDILQPQSAEATTADLPSRLQQLSTATENPYTSPIPDSLPGSFRSKKRYDGETPQPNVSTFESPSEVNTKTPTKKNEDS